MTLELLFNKFYYLINFAFQKRKIFFTWMLIYIVGLMLLIFYKFNNFELDLKIKIFDQYPPMERMYSDGMESLMYRLIKIDLREYEVYNDNYLLSIYLTGNSIEEISSEVDKIMQISEAFKVDVLNYVAEINESLDNEYYEFIWNLKDKDFTEREVYFGWYMPHVFANKLFQNTFSKIYIIDDYSEENIRKVSIEIFIKILSIYVTMLYIFNLIILIFFQNYKKWESSKN